MIRTYLVECYWPGVTEQAYAASVARAGQVVRELHDSGHDVRFLDSLLVPADESVFYRFAGASVAEIERVCTQAALPFARIIEYIDTAEASDESGDVNAEGIPS